MIRQPNDSWAVAHIRKLAAELVQALDGRPFGTVTPDALDDRGGEVITLRETLTSTRDRLNAFLR